ncbi:FGGY-family carbohydrate kinase [Ornithinimicrobium sp. LYQ92]|uniref:FGGY-family carbohydrate kinase n=1 Tax=Serinicoccus sp. LYQ92 TaxID=3378798 RepID=UPI003853B67A
MTAGDIPTDDTATGVPCYLGVDIGTSSSKGVLVSPDGEVLRSAVREHRVSRPAPGQVEMDGELWWEEFRQIAEELTGDAPQGPGYARGDAPTAGSSTPGDLVVLGVGVSGMGPCVLLTDEDDVPVRPAILYGVDTRAGEQIISLHEQLGGPEVVMEGSGSVLTTQAVGPKLRWVAEHEPEAWARARRLFMPASWLAYRLTGEYVLDRHSASQCTPLLDRHTQEWHADWAPLVAEHLELPPLRWPAEQVGTMREPVAGIPAGTPVVAGTIDAWTEALSVGAQQPGDLMLMYGTTLFLIATGTAPVASPVMWGTTGALPGTFNLAGGMATSGALTAWVRELAGDVPYETLLAEAALSPAGAHGLLALPYFAGERTPVQDPDARGVLAGLTLSHTRGDLYRAMLEATAFGVRHNVEALREAGVPIDRVVAVGGGTQGGLWTQIVSDVTGLEQVVRRTSIGASYGAAWLAATAVASGSGSGSGSGDSDGDGDDSGGAPDITAWNPTEVVVRHDPSTRETYDRLYAAYRDLYPATREIAHTLADLQRSTPLPSSDPNSTPLPSTTDRRP